jgi:hypothetical protein
MPARAASNELTVKPERGGLAQVVPSPEIAHDMLRDDRGAPPRVARLLHGL